MHITLHRRHEDFAIGRARRAQLFLLGLHKGHQMRNRGFHDARRFHDLRQEHFTRAEEITHNIHAVHQRTFNDVKRALCILARFFRILDNVIRNAAHQRMLKAFIDGQLAPLIIDNFGFGLAVAAIVFCNIEQTVRRVRAAIQDDVLDPLAQLIWDIIINRQLARIDNRHIETRWNGVIEKDRMHGFTHRIVPAKGKANIRQSARNTRMRQVRFDTAASFEEMHGVIIMLFNPCRHGENIRIKNDVFWREIHFIDEQIISPLTDFEFMVCGLRLAFFIKRHDNSGSAQIAYNTCMGQELFFTLFHRDRVDDSFALHAFQTCFEDFPFGAINHHRHAGDVRLACHEL